MNPKALKHIYILAAILVIVALAKDALLDQVLNPKFLIFEFISFLIFLFIIYLVDKMYKRHNEVLVEKQEESEKLKDKYEEQIEDLNQQIADFRNKNSKQISSNTEIAVVINNLKNDLTTDSSGLMNNENRFLIALSHQYEIGLGIYYSKEEPSLRYVVKEVYGISDDFEVPDFGLEEGIHAQAVANGKPIVISDVYEDYFEVVSCSGSAKPKFIYFLPIIKEDKVLGLVEVASFKSINIVDCWSEINDFLVVSELI